MRKNIQKNIRWKIYVEPCNSIKINREPQKQTDKQKQKNQFYQHYVGTLKSNLSFSTLEYKSYMHKTKDWCYGQFQTTLKRISSVEITFKTFPGPDIPMFFTEIFSSK